MTKSILGDNLTHTADASASNWAQSLDITIGYELSTERERLEIGYQSNQPK